MQILLITCYLLLIVGFTNALRNALRAEARATAEAAKWREESMALQERCEKQENLLRLLRSQASPMSQTRSCTLPDIAVAPAARTSLDLDRGASRSPSQPPEPEADPPTDTSVDVRSPLLPLACDAMA